MMMTLRPITDVKGDLSRIFEEMDRMLEPLSPAWRPAGRAQGQTPGVPAINLALSEQELIIEASVAGYAPEDIDVEVENNVLMISARGDNAREHAGKVLHREIFEGQFTRKMTLPAEVRPEDAKASFKDGLLTIKIPLAVQTRRTKVAITQAESAVG
ncbi:MAG: Hsp20/alpha crystallin family protein [Vampirovibrionales bacterium]|nr:Hsp20/alpha crystallin family protein [Vampirovibrionales bacterium]